MLADPYRGEGQPPYPPGTFFGRRPAPRKQSEDEMKALIIAAAQARMKG